MNFIKKVSNKITKKLSKKEKQHLKSIIESTIYILAIIVIIFANIFGSIYIRMIPLLFILGIIGKIVFNRPIVTSVFSVIVSICFVKLSGITSLKENLLISFSMGLYVCLGEITGFMLQIILKGLKSRKKTKKVVISYIVVPIVFVIILGVKNYLNSNIFTYLKYENELINYLEKNYNDRNFKILNAHYNFIGDKNFKFSVKEDTQNRVYNFVVYIDNKLDVQDGIILSELSVKEAKYNSKLNIYLKENGLLEKYSNIEIKFKTIDTDEIELEITKIEENIDDNITLEFSKMVSYILKDLENFELMNNVNQVFISLVSKNNKQEDLFSYIYLERYKNNNEKNIEKDYEYINRSLKIEFID